MARCHHRLVLTETSTGRPPQVKRTKAAAPRAPRTGTPRVEETGPQRAVREAEEQFRALLSGHIADMRRRGVCEEVLGPFERELLRLGPRTASV